MNNFKTMMRRTILLCMNEVYEMIGKVKESKENSFVEALTGSEKPAHILTLTQCIINLAAAYTMLGGRRAWKKPIELGIEPGFPFTLADSEHEDAEENAEP